MASYIEIQPPQYLLPAVDEVEKVTQQRLAVLVGHIFRFAFAAVCDEAVHQAKMDSCYGCETNQPSQRHHSCLMMDQEDAWSYYFDRAMDKMDLLHVLNISRQVCAALGFTLHNDWEDYLTELTQFPRTWIYLSVLELEHYKENSDLRDRILTAIYYVFNEVTTFSIAEHCDSAGSSETEPIDCASLIEIHTPQDNLMKKEQNVDVDLLVNELVNEFYF